ncbi:hypothetical protein Amsp01_042840 [Amycolatopsis sp. NBRC 101858]|uniref:TRAFAC clade GTPase domain-containing protein n=1 Tax=Amycolatopsis sp. NBRC 101858 TaxID=3032200 RepID=UPI0024A49608|nr:hypothetical protein [Amycolatopsis sp. NBRC 101858]GLY38260.1 hypothetical protein Amsp01_042840 [Amycolatopsis sp. NBRC 101858]
MPYLIGFVAAIIALYFVAWLVVAGLLWFFLPALTIVLPVAAAAGVLMAFGSALLTLTGRRGTLETVTPDRVAAGTSRLRRPRRGGTVPRDRAWPGYFGAQARVDLAAVWQSQRDLLASGWGWIGEAFRRSWPGRVTVLLVLGPGWLAVSAGALAGTAVVVGVGGAVLAVLWALWAVPAGLLRAADRLIRRKRRADASCPPCYYVTALPVFACPGCGEIHRDLRPGQLGGLWRRCGCGTVLPTSVLRAARSIPPRCPRCLETLPADAALVTEVRLPVFGPVSAGKTRLVHTGLLAIRDRVAAAGGTVEFVDRGSRQAFDYAVSLLGAGGDTVKTPAGELPPAITVRYTAGRRRALLHLFDAAGEFYADRDDNTKLEFLDHAQGLVFVVDPFSLPWVRDQLGGTASAALLAKANPAAEAPENVYHVTAKRLRDYGVKTQRQRLAVTVVKADLLAGLPLAEDLEPGNVKAWLERAGLDNLVLAADRDFGDVRYFVVASLTGLPAGDPRSPATPFAWLAARTGLRLWTGPAAEPAPGDPDKEPEEAL